MNIENPTIKFDYSLRDYNTFNIDSYAKYYAEVKDIEELLRILKFINTMEGFNISLNKIENIFILGGGSNILFTNNYDGLVIKNNIIGINKVFETNEIVRIKVGAGVNWNDLVEFCNINNFWGIENLVSIPGTIGGATVQNIGAYGAQLEDVFYSLNSIHLKTLKKRIFMKKNCEFGYRKSVFNSSLVGQYIITDIILELSKIPKVNLNYKIIADEINNLITKSVNIDIIKNIVKKIRLQKLPNPEILGNAGSFFKNPLISKSLYENILKRYKNTPIIELTQDNYKIPSAWLIESIGYKGVRENETGTYLLSPGVIVNYGYAKGNEIFEFSKKLKKLIFENFDITIEEEVLIL